MDIQNIAWAIPLIFFGASICMWCICCCVCCRASSPADFTLSTVTVAPIQVPFNEDPV